MSQRQVLEMLNQITEQDIQGANAYFDKLDEYAEKSITEPSLIPPAKTKVILFFEMVESYIKAQIAKVAAKRRKSIDEIGADDLIPGVIEDIYLSGMTDE